MEPAPGTEWNQVSPSSSDGEEDQPASSASLSYFERERHLVFLGMMYQMLPHHYQSQEINHITLAHFAISGLHLLGALDRVDKDAVSNWVLSLQAHPGNEADLKSGELYGFHGSRSSQFTPDDNGVLIHNGSHLASTYCALTILKTVGYNFANIDHASILTSMRNLQQHDGSFMPIHCGAETDLRFVYCAAAICFMLEDWSGMDREKAKDYILNCQSYDGGFGLIPGSESHGGGTYCAVASLRLMGFIEDDVLSKTLSSSVVDLPLLLNWCLQVIQPCENIMDCLNTGRPEWFQILLQAICKGGSCENSEGFTNFIIARFCSYLNRRGKRLMVDFKEEPTSLVTHVMPFVLRMLGAYMFIDREALRGFLLSCQSEYGGFSKYPGELPDLYHSYYGYTAFSLLDEPGLNPLCAELGMTDFSALGI